MEEEEKKDIRQQDATAQDGDAASGKSDRRKKLEREIGVELATYGKDQGGEQGTEREPSNEYIKSSKTVTRNVYDHTPEEAGKLSMRYAGDVQDDLADRGLTLGEIVMRNYPKPAYAADDEKALKRRRTAALLSDSFKLISDMAAGAYGGNIYKRDNSKTYDRIDAGLQKLKDDYMRERDKWLNAQLAARQGDRDTFLANARMFYDDLRRPRQETESMTNRDIYEHQKDMDERGMKLREDAQRQQRRYYNWMFGGKDKAEDNNVSFSSPRYGNITISNADGFDEGLVMSAFNEMMKYPTIREDLEKYIYSYMDIPVPKNGFGTKEETTKYILQLMQNGVMKYDDILNFVRQKWDSQHSIAEYLWRNSNEFDPALYNDRTSPFYKYRKGIPRYIDTKYNLERPSIIPKDEWGNPTFLDLDNDGDNRTPSFLNNPNSKPANTPNAQEYSEEYLMSLFNFEQ